MNTKKNTLQSIMDIGLQLVQERGYNGFSYADIAEAVGIRKASIHYHFPSKQDLVQAVLLQYRKDFMDRLQAVKEQDLDSQGKLTGFFGLYRETLEDNAKLCLCSMMAAELHSFPEEIRAELNLFFRANESWVEDVLAQGQEEGAFNFSISTGEQAKILVAFVQGAQLMTRSLGDIHYFDTLVSSCMSSLK
ncbi:TetR/AcrR family transcriptional regulator [Paenibacillus agri]|uniref:TetR/AcrR family transcriptional regulator n=1 Tax=Paenibacillus agri TaxID=2744309 RepID=A0A850ENA8_9BACL|nr:TetR/AcrR family transcriptional regulator [Paenibacillus agri]NUU61239.1 TetR/AcrR family transcriptional regulator [Paenibacillus agri]